MSLPEDLQTGSLSLEEFWQFAETHEGFWELEDGVPVKLEGPSIAHQWISSELTMIFRLYFKGKKCRALHDMDVWIGDLPVDTASHNKKNAVRRPDFVVYCNKEQEYHNLILSPQLVIEIWSPTNTPKERMKKMTEYYRIGVQEFWQIDFTAKDFSIVSFADANLRFLSGGSFRDPLKSELFPGLQVDLSEYYSEFG